MTDDDNPFASSSHEMPIGPAGEGTREPVSMDVGAVFGRAWELLLEEPVVVLGAAFIPLILSLLVGVPQGLADVYFETVDDESLRVGWTLISMVLSIGSGLIGIFFMIGQVRIYASLAFGRPASLGMLVGGLRYFLPTILAYIVLGFGTLIGLLLFIVPGIIFALGMQMVFYAVVIEELGPIDALRRSWELTDGNKLNIFVIVLVSGIGALFAACVTCGIGYLLAIPLLSLIQGVMYHSLASEHPDVSDLV